MTDEPEPLPPPPPGVLARTRRDGRVWRETTPGTWINGRWTMTWPELADGRRGPVDLLVPVPYAPGAPHPTSQDVAENVLNPVAALMQQLAAAAGAAITAVVADAYQRGTVDAQRSTPANPGPFGIRISGAYLPSGVAAVMVGDDDPSAPTPLRERVAIIRDDPIGLAAALLSPDTPPEMTITPPNLLDRLDQ